MADPLSIATGAITLLSTVAGVAKGLELLQSVRKAPIQITLLMNEITDLRLVVSMAESTVRNAPADMDHSVVHAICELASRANGTLFQLTKVSKRLFREETTADGTRIHVLSRRVWLREKTNVESHCKNLRKTRNNLTAALTVLASSQMGVRPRYQLELRTSIAGIEKSIEDQFSKLNENLTLFQKTVAAPSDSLENCTADTPLMHQDPSHMATEHEKQSPGLVSIQTMGIMEECEEFCPCECHARRTLQTPPWMRKVVGTLFFSYSGSPVLGRRPCNYRPCKRVGLQRTQYTYHFPTWMLARCVSVYYTQNFLAGGGSWTYSIPKMLPDENPVWRFLNTATVPQLADVIPKNGVALCDTNKDGKSLLHFAVEWERPGMCSFLLQHGSNQFFEDGTGISAAMMAWEMVLPDDATNSRKDNVTSIQRLFKNECVYDTLEFSPLHLAVINMSDGEFEKQIKLNLSSLNSQDALHRTPLTWACAGGQQEKARMLIEAGATTSFSDKHGKTALHWAAASKAIGIVRILLQYGAPLESRDIFGRTPIWEASKAPNSHQIIEILVEHGAEIDSRDYIYERTPLQCASYHGQAANVLSLLQFGADIETRMSTGRTPLLNAIAYNQFPTVELLVREGANANVFDSDGRGTLHLTALFGSLKVMQAMQQADLAWVGVDKKDNEGRTAEVCFSRCRASFYTGKAHGDGRDEDAFRELIRWAQKAKTGIFST